MAIARNEDESCDITRESVAKGKDRDVSTELLPYAERDTPTCDEGRPAPFLCSQRWILAYLSFYFGFVILMLRVNMSLTLPYMVKSELLNTTFDNVTNTSMVLPDECSATVQSMDINNDAEFTWSKLVQSMVLAGYFWGYIVTQIVGGWVAGRYGGKRVIAAGMALSSVLTLLSPVLTRASPYALMAARFFTGVCAGLSFPALFNLIGAWSLPHERSRMIGIFFFGAGLGTILGMLTSGLLADKGFDNGWASVFYVHGIFSVFFVVLWVICVYDTPQQHPRISEAEMQLFEEHQRTSPHKRDQATPWRKLLTYVPVWVVCLTHTVQNLTIYLLMLCLPLYLKDVMRLDIQNNSLFTSLPFVTNVIGVCITGLLADYLVARNWFSTSTIRKLFQCTGFLGMAVLLIIPGYLDCTQAVPAILCISASTLFEALGQTAGYSSNIVDIAPRHASVIIGISNTFATIPGMIAPIIVAELTPTGTIDEWRVVFYIASGFSVLGAIVFGFFSSSELAPWATEPPLKLTVDQDTTISEEEVERLH